MRSRQKQSDPEDDGRVIAPMNVPGMPWYMQRSESSAPPSGGASEPLSRGERFAFAWGMIKAVLLVTGVFFAVYFGFILFCTEVWFR